MLHTMDKMQHGLMDLHNDYGNSQSTIIIRHAHTSAVLRSRRRYITAPVFATTIVRTSAAKQNAISRQRAASSRVLCTAPVR